MKNLVTNALETHSFMDLIWGRAAKGNDEKWGWVGDWGCPVIHVGGIQPVMRDVHVPSPAEIRSGGVNVGDEICKIAAYDAGLK